MGITAARRGLIAPRVIRVAVPVIGHAVTVTIAVCAVRNAVTIAIAARPAGLLPRPAAIAAAIVVLHSLRLTVVIAGAFTLPRAGMPLVAITRQSQDPGAQT